MRRAVFVTFVNVFASLFTEERFDTVRVAEWVKAEFTGVFTDISISLLTTTNVLARVVPLWLASTAPAAVMVPVSAGVKRIS